MRKPKNKINSIKKKLPIITGGILALVIAVFLIGLIINSFSGGTAIKVVSAQSVFQSSEIPQFVFVYKNQTNIFVRFFNSISNLFSSENKEITATVKIFDNNDKEIDGLNPQIKEESSGKYNVDLDHSHFQQELRPGQYEIKMEINDHGKTYSQTQSFFWGVLAINTNKSIYSPGEEAYLQLASLDKEGHTLCNSRLKLEIRNSKFEIRNLSTDDGSIQYSGECKGDNVTNVPDYFAHYNVSEPGKYEMKLTNLDTGFEITDYFEVRGSVEFDIERTGPTRIWPYANYPMKIKITANQDFEGQIIETVPMTFAIEERTGATQSPNGDNYTKTITWQTKIKKGETKELSYSIDFPNVSPYFYLIGPLRMLHATPGQSAGQAGYVFHESRQWQIAADAETEYYITYDGGAGAASCGDNCFTTPTDWNGASNSVEVIGGGGGGGDGVNKYGGGGGGGGAYARGTRLTLSGQITFGIGASGSGGSSDGNGVSGGDTYFNATSFANCESVGSASGGGNGCVGAEGGKLGYGNTTLTGGIGGYGAVGNGVIASGGNGGLACGNTSGGGGGGGGGGAGGPQGDYFGNNGGIGTGDGSPALGGGGGGGGGGTNGSAATQSGSPMTCGSYSVGTDVGGVGGANYAGNGAGPGGDADGSAGTVGGGGGGGDDGGTGGTGGPGTEWTVSYGSGGGGGGGGDVVTGGYGGKYGGGGGGGEACTATTCYGAGGLIHIAYTPASFTISGTCKQYDQSTNSTEAATIKIAVNTTINASTASCSAGSWTATLTTIPVTSDIITVWVDNVDETYEAVAVTKYDGTGYAISGMPLYEHHLVIGSYDSITASNSDLMTYDFSVSGDEDIFFDATATSLVACAISGCENVETYIAPDDSTTNTYYPNSAGSTYVETHDIEVTDKGVFNMTGTNNYASISGSWVNDGTFTVGTSTIFFVASDSTETVSASAAGIFNNVQFGDSATTAYTGHWDRTQTLDVNGNLTIDAGTLHVNNSYSATLAGNLSIAANGAYLRSNGTFTFDGATTPVTWTDSATTKSDMGTVSINGTTKRAVLGSSVKVNELTIAASQILDLGSSGYTLTIGGDGQTTTRPLIKTGTLDCGTNSTVEYLASQSTDIENTNYFNLKLASASTTFYINGSASSITVSGSFNIDSGTFNGGDDTVTLKKTGTGVFSASGTFAPATGIINYTGDGATTIASMSDGGNTGYYSLQIGNAITQTGNRTYTIDGNTTSTYVQVGPSSGSYYHTLALSAYTLTITGTGTSFMYQDSSYGHLSADTGTVSFIGNGATDVLGDPIFWIYYNLSIGTANNANVTYTAINGNVSVQNQLSLQSAGSGYTNTFALGARNLDVGTSSITNSGTISVPIRSAITQTSGTTTLFTSDNATTPTIGGAGTTTFGDFSIANSNNIAFTFTLAGDVGASGSFNLTGHASYIHHLDFSSSNYELSVGGNFAVGQNASISARLGTVTFGGSTTSTTPNINATGKFEPYNLTINKTSGTDSLDNVTLASNLIVRNTLTLTDGQLIQGNYDVRAEGSSAVSIASGTDKEWTNIGTGDLVLGGTFANAGSVAFDTNDNDCSVVTDDIQITSTAGGTQRTWSGTGEFNMYNVYVQDMTRSDSPNITVYNGSSSNVTGNWTFSTCQAAPIVSQAHFRWRSDDNNEASATWKRAEDNLHSGQARSQNVRLRFSIKNTGANATGYQFGLQVAPKNSNDCSSVASSSYTPVPPAGSCGVDVACMADSTQFTSGDASTLQLTAEGTWVAGEMVDNTTSISDAITINENYYTEVEYNFQFTTYAAYGANYCFRVTNNGALIDTYTKLAEATVEGTSLLNRLKGALRIKGGTRLK